LHYLADGVISDGYHGCLEIALPNLSERESKKKQFGKYGLRAYLGIKRKYC